MNGKALDFVLVAAICLSGTYIGYRLLTEKTQPTSSLSRDTPPVHRDAFPGLLQPAPPTTARQFRYQPSRTQSLLFSRQYDPTSWSEIANKPRVKRYQTEQSESCKDPSSQQMKSYSILDYNVASKFKSKGIGFFVDMSDRICVRKHSRLSVFSFGQNPGSKIFELLGDVVVEDILEVPAKELSTELLDIVFSEQSTAVTELADVVLKLGRKNVYFIRVSNPQQTTAAKNLPLEGFPRYRTITSFQLASWLQAHPNAVVVDVRSPAERMRLPVAFRGSVLNLPYSVADTSWTFRWDRTVSELDADSFDFSKATELIRESTPLLLLGASAFDGRPVWALRVLFELGVGAESSASVAWFYDGVPAFNNSLAAR